MKKVIRKIFLLLIALVGIFTQTNSVSAATLDMRYQKNVYYVHVEDNGSHYSSFQLAMYYVDGKLAYCIEPGVMIYSTTYAIGDWNVTSLSPAQRLRIEQIGYFGYEYPGHQNVKYYMAAQELIWKTVTPLSASWTTEAKGKGSVINIDAEKNEIERLISRSNIRPSFNNQTINATVGDEVILTDTNNILSDYFVYDNGSQDVSVNGNQLKIKVNNTGDNQIKLLIKNYDNDVNLVYYNTNSQKLAHTRLSDPLTSTLRLHSTAGNVTINKVDKDTKKSKAQGEATLEGAIYDVYNSNDEIVTTITTNSEGKITSSNLPSLGHYYLKERKASKGYKIDETKYEFDMTIDNLYPTIKVYEKVIERKFDFTKVYADNKTGIMNPEVNVKFGIYNNKNELVNTYITDLQGNFEMTLPYGKYVVKQLTSTKGYEKAKDFTIEVKEDGGIVKKVIANAEITARLKVIKIDKDTGVVIKRSGIKFKIINAKTKKYVKQTITYPSAKTIDTFETDENGILITPYPLESGTYFLEEVDQKIDGYLWNKNSVEFTIDENSKLVNDDEFGILYEVKFENKEVKGEITIHKNGEKAKISNNGYKYVKINLANVKFGLYAKEDIYSANGVLKYSKNQLINTYITDSNGNIKIQNLYLEKYYLKELETDNDHVLSEKKYEFELKYKDQYTPIIKYNLVIDNYLKKGILDFTKTDFTTGKVIPNTLIEVYNKNDELVYTGKTDKNGKIRINNLPYGEYYIIEKEPSTGYKLNNEKVYFEIKEDGQVVKANMTNEKIKGTLEFTKVDVSSSEALPNTTIQIYNEKDELIFIGTTNEEGKIVIANLEYGKYYILEKNAPKGYKLNEEKMWFEIKEDGQVVKATMKDERIIEVPNTSSNTYLDLIAGGIVLLGASLILVSNLKNKRK